MDFFSLSQTFPHFFNAGFRNSAENDTFAIPNDTFAIANDTFTIANDTLVSFWHTSWFFTLYAD